MLQHSIEVANMCGILAAEMKLNPRIARRCGLLHDIGQVAVEGMEGSHASIGAEICSRYDEASEVTQAIREHHSEDISTLSPYGLILHTTNMISRTRPGVRKDAGFHTVILSGAFDIHRGLPMKEGLEAEV